MIRCFALLLAVVVSQLSSAAEPKLAERWAVLVGVDDYTHANDLRYCGADQTALRERLIASGFRTDNIVLLNDKAEDSRYRPSQRNIEDQLRLVVGSAEADDLLVIGFSGHGVSIHGKSYLCPNDARLGDPTTLIPLDGVYDQLRNCAARFKLVIVDACRNDPTLGGARSFTASEGTKQLARSLQELRLPEGVVLLNSCAPGEISWEEEKFGHGVYMHFVLEAMAGAGDANADGAVSLNELQRYVGSRTKAYVMERFTAAQRPFFRSEGEADAMDFNLLSVRREPSPLVRGEAAAKTITVPANRFWIATGVHLRAGSKVDISAIGVIEAAPPKEPRAFYHEVSPDGRGEVFDYLPHRSLPALCLVGRVGDGASFRVGKQLILDPQTSGELWLGINDDLVEDNAGEWTVRITAVAQ